MICVGKTECTSEKGLLILKDVKVNITIIILWKSLAYVTEHSALLITIGETGNQIKLDQVKWNVDLEESSQVKTFHSREENQQTQPTYCTV